MPSHVVQTKYYVFNQNNSGGGFDIDATRGIGEKVVIEAINYLDANDRAQRIGIYFDGCADGRDCSCCGDRWSPLWGEDTYSTIDVNNPEEIKKQFNDWGWTKRQHLFIHTLDGEIIKITKDTDNG